MTDDEAFRDLIRRVRAGDQQAACDLVRQYEPEIRRAVRVRLDEKLGRVLDSVDVCQSVMGNFFVRAAAGQFDLEHPAQLFKLLVTMARNKILDHARKPANRPVALGDEEWSRQVAANTETAQALASEREMLEEIRRRLSDEERQIADLRAQGRDWATVARHLGSSPEALRKKLARAVDRVARELGLDDVTD